MTVGTELKLHNKTANDTIECSGESSNGGTIAASGSKEVTGVVVKFTGCEAFLNAAVACGEAKTTGAKAKEIVTNSLTGELVKASEAEAGAQETGLKLSPTAPATELASISLAQPGCAIATVKVTKAVIGRVPAAEVGAGAKLKGHLEFEAAGVAPFLQQLRFVNGAKPAVELSTSFGAASNIMTAHEDVTFAPAVEVN